MSSTDSSELETRIELDSGSATRTVGARDPVGLDAAPEHIDRFRVASSSAALVAASTIAAMGA